MFKSIYLPPAPEGLVEALDPDGRPLCLLAARTVLEQNLPHRGVVVFAFAASGEILLAEEPGPIFNATIHAPLQAGLAAGEFAERMLVRTIGHIAHMREIVQLKSHAESLTIFVAYFSSALLKAVKRSDFLLTDRQEIPELAKRGLIAPLVMEILPHLA